jgi:hypothetical protein
VKARSARPRSRALTWNLLADRGRHEDDPIQAGCRTMGERARRDPETRTNVNVISWPMKRLTIDVPIDLHIRLKTGCAVRGEKIADVVRVLIEREFPPQT